MRKIIKKISLVAVLVFAIVFMSACGKSNSIIGEWAYLKDGNVTDNIYYKFEKGGNGSYTYADSKIDFTYEDRGTKVVIKYKETNTTAEFDYSISDDVLTIKDSFGSSVTYKRK